MKYKGVYVRTFFIMGSLTKNLFKKTIKIAMNTSELVMCERYAAFWGQNVSVIFDPRGQAQSRPLVITIFTQVVVLSVRPPQNFKIERKITAGLDFKLPEWIIDDSSLILKIYLTAFRFWKWIFWSLIYFEFETEIVSKEKNSNFTDFSM